MQLLDCPSKKAQKVFYLPKGFDHVKFFICFSYVFAFINNDPTTEQEITAWIFFANMGSPSLAGKPMDSQTGMLGGTVGSLKANRNIISQHWS